MNFEKKIVVRAQNEQTLEKITNTYGNINAGVKQVMDNYVTLQSRCFREIKEVFSENELNWLIARANGTVFDPTVAISKDMTIAGLQDYYNMENQDIDFDKIITKISSMSASQVFFVNEYCYLQLYKDII